MVPLLSAVLAVMAVGSWAVVVYAAVRILVMVPQGKRLRALRLLGRWKFPELAYLAGAGTIRHSNLFLRAMMFFLGVVACSFLLWAVTFIDAQNGPPQLSMHAAGRGAEPWAG
ncbi:MAG TPA: hypothetical protein VHB23_05765 [Devosiaceae bacterium]|jgi:hypothetical protein|nr:hypothetical protein [Devosiaceae bacterium]